mgnify:CR=1 FL=1
MSHKARLLLIFLINGFFLFLDRLFKYLSLRELADNQLLNQFLGWQPSLNAGLAFSLPMPVAITVILTIPIIIIIFYLLHKNINHFPLNFSLTLVIAGALSNLYDRIIYRHTIDYLLIFTAVINIADVMITAGFVIYLLSRKFCHSCESRNL